MKRSVLLVSFVMGCVSESAPEPAESELAPQVSTAAEEVESPHYLECSLSEDCVYVQDCIDGGGWYAPQAFCGPGFRVCCSW